MGADLGQLASGGAWRGLWGRGEATMDECVQGDQGGQQLILTQGGRNITKKSQNFRGKKS